MNKNRDPYPFHRGHRTHTNIYIPSCVDFAEKKKPVPKLTLWQKFKLWVRGKK